MDFDIIYTVPKEMKTLFKYEWACFSPLFFHPSFGLHKQYPAKLKKQYLLKFNTQNATADMVWEKQLLNHFTTFTYSDITGG